MFDLVGDYTQRQNLEMGWQENASDRNTKAREASGRYRCG
jgi:hypothetical protein